GALVQSGAAAGGWLAASFESHRPLRRRVVQLCDSAVPASKQPYHAKMGTLHTGDVKIEVLRKINAKAAHDSVSEWMNDIDKHDQKIGEAGLVIGSDIDPARIANDHIRAHALEGRLFRTVLKDALQSCGLNSSVIVERNAYKQAGEVVKKTEKQLKE